jgi:hypothetical protein
LVVWAILLDFNQFGRAGKKPLENAFTTPKKSRFERKTTVSESTGTECAICAREARHGHIVWAVVVSHAGKQVPRRGRESNPHPGPGEDLKSARLKQLASKGCAFLGRGSRGANNSNRTSPVGPSAGPRPSISIDRLRAPAVEARASPAQACDSQRGRCSLRCTRSGEACGRGARPVLASRRLTFRPRTSGHVGAGRRRRHGGAGDEELESNLSTVSIKAQPQPRRHCRGTVGDIRQNTAASKLK